MLTALQKNELLCQLEVSVEKAQTGAGIGSLGEIETEVASLRTAYAADPAGISEADLISVKNMIDNCKFGVLTSSSEEWAEAQAVVNAAG